MSRHFTFFVLAPALVALAHAQTKPEFEVASIKANEAQSGFRFASEAVSGGPGTSDPAMFRCTRCSLATLIVKAFNLQPYQFPGRTALTDNTYDVVAKLPTGATAEQFSAMLQNLLTERFGLASHFQEKQLKGYHLVVAKDGPKLQESGATPPPAADQHGGFGQGETHSHSGAIAFGTSASFRAANQTTADLARVLSDQIGLPVDDQTGLKGKYDIALRWTGNAAAAHSGDHSDGAYSAGTGHGGRDGGGNAPAGALPGDSGPSLFEALQQQLGLRLVSGDQTLARLFVVDKVSKSPTEN